ncbi:MAG: V8-like Glu-specific endopeptidase [Flammeovirgaceae bacterium]|jgi:V8-like Glu-specific endopeptidase
MSKLKNATCIILSKNKDGEVIDSGTGFFISENGLFLTAAHVVKDEIDHEQNGEYSDTEKVVSWEAYYNKKSYTVKVLYKEYLQNNGEWHDLAVCKITTNDKICTLKITNSTPTKTEIQNHSNGEIIIIGGYSKLVLKKYKFGSYEAYSKHQVQETNIHEYYEFEAKRITDVLCRDGSIKCLDEFPNGFNMKFYGLEYNEWVVLNNEPGGISGGAVINSKDELVGVFFSGTRSEGQLISNQYILSNQKIQKVISENN